MQNKKILNPETLKDDMCQSFDTMNNLIKKYKIELIELNKKYK